MSNIKINLERKHVDLIKQILIANLAEGTTVWIFGSRAMGTAKKFSDIDLLIDVNSSPLPLSTLAKLANAFDDSLLPYKVDLVDANTISDAFHRKIECEKQLFLTI